MSRGPTIRTSPGAAGQTTPPNIELVPIAKIIIGDRARTNLGDIDALARSIEENTTDNFDGLLHPILLTSQYKLVAGFRRLKAFEKLGRTHIRCIRVTSLDDAVRALKAEHDENYHTEPMRMSDLMKIADKIEGLERQRAKERQEATRARKGEKVGAQGGATKAPRSAADRGKTRDKVADALGISHTTYAKAKKVAEAAKADPDRYGDLPARMDAEGKVDPVYKELKAREACDDLPEVPNVAKVETDQPKPELPKPEFVPPGSDPDPPTDMTNIRSALSLVQSAVKGMGRAAATGEQMSPRAVARLRKGVAEARRGLDRLDDCLDRVPPEWRPNGRTGGPTPARDKE
jgi:ParB-like chromosome segregation protein Spo0J